MASTGAPTGSVNPVQNDWENREFIQNIQYNIMQIASFLNKFDMDSRFRLARINQKLTNLERQMNYIEAAVHGFTQRGEAKGADEEN